MLFQWGVELEIGRNLGVLRANNVHLSLAKTHVYCGDHARFMSVWAGCTLTSPSTNMTSHEVLNNSQPLGISVNENTPL